MALPQQGYVLLFVLGLLVLVSTVALGITAGRRLDAQLLSREKTALQEEYLLRGAAQYTAMQLNIARAVQARRLEPDDPALRQWPLWRATGGRYEWLQDGLRVSVEIEDLSGLPDANVLTPQEWQRLLLLLGMASAEDARILAGKLVALRDDLARHRGSTGFASLQEVLQWTEIPPDIAFGGTKATPLGLQHLLVVGTRNRLVHLDKTPLLWMKVLGNATDAQLQQLETLRKAGPIPSAQAQQWLAGTGLAVQPPDKAVSAVRARLRLASAPAQTRSMVAILVGENGSFSVADHLLDPDGAGR